MPRRSTCETIQVSIAHAYPGTEFYDYAKANGFITNEKMEDGGGHQMAHIEYPGLPIDYVMEMVHRFYDEYYFRPKAAFRVVWKAIVNRDVPRLYVEAKVLPEAARAAQQDGEGSAHQANRAARAGGRMAAVQATVYAPCMFEWSAHESEDPRSVSCHQDGNFRALTASNCQDQIIDVSCTHFRRANT